VIGGDERDDPAAWRRVPADGKLARGTRAYRFSRNPSDDTRRKQIRAGRELVDAECKSKGVAIPEATEAVDSKGAVLPLDDYFFGTFMPSRIRVRGKSSLQGGQIVRPEAPAPVMPPLPPPASGFSHPQLRAPDVAAEGKFWVFAEPHGETEIGDISGIEPGDIGLGGRTVMRNIGNDWVKLELVDADGVHEYIAGRRLLLGIPSADDAEELRKIKAGKSASSLRDRLGVDGGSKTPPNEDKEDVRTLWVDYDAQGERYKDWRTVVRESSVNVFGDNPLEGPSTVLTLSKHYLRHGGDPRQWLILWMREKGIASNDRVIHEMRVLTDLLYYAGTYDQLNIGSLLCLEVAGRRLQLCVEAYSNPSKPCWDAAKFFSGRSVAEDGIAPEMRRYIAKEARNDAEILLARSRGRELKALGGSVNDEGVVDDAVATGGLPGAKGGRGRGAGRKKVLAPSPP